VGSLAWTNPTYIQADDSSRATAQANDEQAYSEWLVGRSYGFSIPSGSTINGITLSIQRYASQNAVRFVKDYQLYLTKNGTSAVGSNKADTTTKWPTSEGAVSYGGAADLWGTTWTAAEINAATFGAMLRATLEGTGGSVVAYVDCYTVTITYTLPVGIKLNGVLCSKFDNVSHSKFNGVA
jgi:hypothetical protein